MITSGRIKIGLFLRPNAASIDDIDNKIAIQHFAFLMTSEGLSAAQQFLKQSGIAFDGPEDTGIADSIFLSDPDGHQVELTAYHVPSPAVSETNLVKDCIASRNLASS
jgi:catechol-2,3-dioxygenase